MRILESCDNFDTDAPPLIESNDNYRFFYRKRRRNFHVAALNPGMPGRELLHCGSIHRTELLRGAHFRSENVDHLSVEYVQRGVLQFRQEERGYELSAGELFLLHPRRRGEFFAVDGSCLKISLLFNGQLLPELLRESGLAAIDAIASVNVAVLESFIRDFETLSLEHGSEAERKNGVLSWRFFQFLRAPHLPERPPAQLAGFERFCLEHLADPMITVGDMAAACRLSESHFIRLCRQHFDATPYQYLIRLRMQVAAKLLLSTDRMPVKQIAEQVGYRNALHFSTEFKKLFGLSPRQYADREQP